MLIKPAKNKLAFVLFPKLYALIEKGFCPMCRKKIKEEDFENEISKKEYSISGMCQTCQNKQFGRKNERRKIERRN